MPPSGIVGMENFFGSNFVYASRKTGTMDKFIDNKGEVQFANGQNNRDSRVSSRDLNERTDWSDGLKALRTDSEGS